MENLRIRLLKLRQVLASSSLSYSILNTDMVLGARIFIFSSVDPVSSASPEAFLKVSLVLHTSFRRWSRWQASLSKSHPLNVSIPQISALGPLLFLLYTLCVVISWAFGSMTSCMCGWALDVWFRPAQHAGQVDSSGRETTFAQSKAGWNPLGILEVSVVTISRTETRGRQVRPLQHQV